MRRLAVALVSLVALGVGVTVAVGSTAGAARAHAATARPFGASVRPHPLPALQPALRRALQRLEHPLRSLRPRAITRTVPIVPGTLGAPCYVAGSTCSIHPCAQFVSPSAPAVSLPIAESTVAVSAPPTARPRCHRVSGPSVTEPVGAVQIAPGTGTVSVLRSTPVVRRSR